MGRTQFEEAGRRLVALHPDVNSTLWEAASDGLTISPEAVHELIRLGRPDVAYYLTLPQNREAALALHGLPPHAQIAKIHEIAKLLDDTGIMEQPEMDGDGGYLERRKARRQRRFA